MKRKLWTLMINQSPVAVVAGDHLRTAWRLVDALRDDDGLPAISGRMEIVPCPKEEARRTVSAARRMGCAETFLICLQKGCFILTLGQLNWDSLRLDPGAMAA